MTDIKSECSPPAPPKTAVSGRRVMLWIVLGAVITPIAVFLFMEVFNQFSPLCNGGSGEAGIACALRQLAVSALSIVPGGVIGLVAAVKFGAKRPSDSG